MVRRSSSGVSSRSAPGLHARIHAELIDALALTLVVDLQARRNPDQPREPPLAARSIASSFWISTATRAPPSGTRL